MRPRPFEAFDMPPLFPETSYSLPSGHATFLFALATGVYAVNRRAGLILFTIAGIISLARIMAGVHYPGDIVAGAFVGITVASACVVLARRTDIIPRVASKSS
jgi:undecaprenyl-diphosphatase